MGSKDFWRTLLDPRGRRSRAGFWAYTGISIAAYLVCLLVASVLDLILPGLDMVAFVLALVAMFVGSLINAIRRLHDLGHSGWWMALIVPIGLLLALASFVESEAGGSLFAGLRALVGFCVLIWLGGIAGQAGPNRFGESPLGESEPASA